MKFRDNALEHQMLELSNSSRIIDKLELGDKELEPISH